MALPDYDKQDAIAYATRAAVRFHTPEGDHFDEPVIHVELLVATLDRRGYEIVKKGTAL